MESLGNDDVSIVYARKKEIVRMANNSKSRRDRSARICDIYCAVILPILFCVTCYQRHSVEQLF